VNVWITTIGTSPFAVVNPFWAACVLDNYVATRIHLLRSAATESNSAQARDWISRILKCYGVIPAFVEHSLDEENMDAFATEFCRVLKSEAGSNIAIDMTPGRKYMSAIALLAGQKLGANRVYYLHLYDASYQDLPFVLIPFNQVRLVNVLDVVGGKD
jgi:hypothetical protein